MWGLTILTNCLLATVTVLLVYIYWFLANHFQYWKKRNLPYVKPSILFGNFQKVFTRHKTIGQVFGDCYLELKQQGLKHGGAFAILGPVYIPVDPDIIKRILITDADNFPNHGFYIDKNDPLSQHMFSLEGNRWKDIRIKLPQAFTSAKMRKMFLMMIKVTEVLQQRLEANTLECPKGIDIKHELSKFTMDVVTTCGFGIETNTLHGKNDDILKHARLFTDYQWKFIKNIFLFSVPRTTLQKWGFRVFKKETTDYVRSMCMEIKKYREQAKVERADIADILIKLTVKNENNKKYFGNEEMDPLNDDEFIAQIWAFICASFETSSATIAFALYELAKNMDCQKKLRDEIDTVLAKNNNKVTYDCLMEMKYLECVVDETLRYYPVLPILPRVCREDYKIPGTDFILQKNNLVVVSNYGIQRDPEYYPNPDHFDPMRFTNENKRIRPFIANLPFGEGPRICVGKRFGLLQTKLAVMNIVKNFEVTLSDKTQSGFSFEPWILPLRKSGGIWIHLKKIDNK